MIEARNLQNIENFYYKCEVISLFQERIFVEKDSTSKYFYVLPTKQCTFYLN